MARAAARAEAQLGERRRVRVVLEPHRPAEARREPRRDRHLVPAAQVRRVAHDAGRGVERTGRRHADRGQRARFDSRLGQQPPADLRNLLEISLRVAAGPAVDSRLAKQLSAGAPERDVQLGSTDVHAEHEVLPRRSSDTLACHALPPADRLEKCHFAGRRSSRGGIEMTLRRLLAGHSVRASRSRRARGVPTIRRRGRPTSTRPRRPQQRRALGPLLRGVGAAPARSADAVHGAARRLDARRTASRRSTC